MNSPPPASRIPVRNVWHMFLYAWELARFQGRFDGQREGSPDLIGLLAWALVHVTRDLLRRGVLRDYVDRSETLRYLRGRVDFATSVRRLDIVHGRVTCRFDEFEHDILANRILRTTILTLLNSRQLSTESHDAVGKLGRALAGLYRSLDGIGILPSVRSEHFGLVRISHGNAHYRLVLEICRLLTCVMLPRQAPGSNPFLDLLADERAMGRVFEAFVRNFYRMHRPEYDVRSRILRWPGKADTTLLPQMQTDVTLRSARRQIIVEAKYYAETLTRHHDAERIRSAHLYQLYAYLRTQEETGRHDAEAEGILIYPAVNVHLDEVYRIQGHVVRVATLDLDQPWVEIERRLLGLIPTEPPISQQRGGDTVEDSAAKRSAGGWPCNS